MLARWDIYIYIVYMYRRKSLLEKSKSKKREAVGGCTYEQTLIKSRRLNRR